MYIKICDVAWFYTFLGVISFFFCFLLCSSFFAPVSPVHLVTWLFLLPYYPFRRGSTLFSSPPFLLFLIERSSIKTVLRSYPSWYLTANFSIVWLPSLPFQCSFIQLDVPVAWNKFTIVGILNSRLLKYSSKYLFTRRLSSVICSIVHHSLFLGLLQGAKNTYI